MSYYKNLSPKSASVHNTPSVSPTELLRREQSLARMRNQSVRPNLSQDARDMIRNDMGLVNKIEKDFKHVQVVDYTIEDDTIMPYYDDYVVFTKDLQVDDMVIFDDFNVYKNKQMIAKSKPSKVLVSITPQRVGAFRSVRDYYIAPVVRLLGVIRKQNKEAYKTMQEYLALGQSAGRKKKTVTKKK